MVDSKMIKIYIMFLVIFSFFAGNFKVISESETFSLSDTGMTESAKNTITEDSVGFNSDVCDTDLGNKPQFMFTCAFHNIKDSSILLLPFALVKLILGLIIILGYGFFTLPIYIQIFLLTPMGIFALIDYIMPYIRGN